MNHVRKQKWLGCAIATAAMIVDRSYEEVESHWPDMDEAETRSPVKLCALLEAVTNTQWHFSPCSYPHSRVSEYVPPQWPVAVWIQDSSVGPRFGQWIVVKDGVIHDPGERTAYCVSDYRLRDWVVTLITQPGPPEEWVRILKRRRNKLLIPADLTMSKVM